MGRAARLRERSALVLLADDAKVHLPSGEQQARSDRTCMAESESAKKVVLNVTSLTYRRTKGG
jgi:hypothetical protein